MKKRIIATATFLVFLSLIISCKKEPKLPDPEDTYSQTPHLPEKTYDYQLSSNDALASLGRVLFYDKNLSLNNSVACGSCHQQSKAFTDNMKFSPGLEDKKTSRNTPSIFAKDGRLFWDGRAESFNQLSVMPVKNHVEMKSEDMNVLSEKLAGLSYYPNLFNKAFGRSIVDSTRIKSALGEFLRNFTFSSTKFHRHQKNGESLNASEQLGKDLFFGKARCSSCHILEEQEIIVTSSGGGWGSSGTTTSMRGKNGYGFTDGDFCIGLDEEYSDNGLGQRTGIHEDKGKFMVPVLLNIEFTGPYMHDGRFKTLEEVVDHYNSGIKPHPNLHLALRDKSAYPGKTDQEITTLLDLNNNKELEAEEMAGMGPARLGLTDNEKRNLVDFLKTLSDPAILTDVKFSDPFTKK